MVCLKKTSLREFWIETVKALAIKKPAGHFGFHLNLLKDGGLYANL